MLTRKPVRLGNHDYNEPGCYFISVCTKEKRCILCDITEDRQTHGTHVRLTELGLLVDRQLREMAEYYHGIVLEQYVVMPNHVHLLIRIDEKQPTDIQKERNHRQNNSIGSFVGTMKRLTQKASGAVFWQSRSYDHIIRNEKDYLRVRQYIENNPAKWSEDGFYIADTERM